MSRIPKSAWAILAVAVVLRLGAAAVLTDNLEPGLDELIYQGIAASIADGDGYPARPDELGGGPSATSPPAYPYFLAAAFAVAGDSATVARLAQVALSTLVVALIGLIAWQLFRERRVALAAMAIAAVYPSLIVLAVPIATEALLFPLVLAAVSVTLAFWARGGLGWAVLAGVLVALAMLSKESALVAFVVLGAALWRPPRWTFDSLAAPAAFLAGVVVVLAPWTIRNAAEFDSFVPLSTRMGVSVAGSFNQVVFDDRDHVWRDPYGLPEFRDELQAAGASDEAEAHDALRDQALEFALDHPLYVAELAAQNGLRLLQVRAPPLNYLDPALLGFSEAANATATFKLAYWSCLAGFLILVALLAVSLTRGEARRVPAFIWALAVLQMLPLLLIAGGPRYRALTELLLIVAVAPAAVALWDALLRRRGSVRSAQAIE